MTVVVDFTKLGAGVVVRCAPGPPGTGLEVLAAAGLSVELVHGMSGFVCRIDGLPGPAGESCATTPPISASWSYWHAERGGSWAYSVVGAGASRPPAGSVDGWAFTGGPGAASPPSVPPPPAPAVPTPAPTVAKTPVPTAKPAVAPTPRPAATSTPGAAASPAASMSLEATASPTATASATPAASPSGSVRPPAPTPTAAAAAAVGPRTDGPSPVGTVAGIGLALVVGGAAIAMQRRGRLQRHG